MLTPLKAWIQTDSFHAVLSERSVRWYNACLLGSRAMPTSLAEAAIVAAVRKDSDHSVRERAVFWLAQSESDAAQAYLEQVLTATH
ncbi:MAG TPA: hypothetical protein VJT10_08270 [Steroidobacteraceae bacterium]|nr:hypothetical protein [Steroidobacteraceae bacterium]